MRRHAMRTYGGNILVRATNAIAFKGNQVSCVSKNMKNVKGVLSFRVLASLTRYCFFSANLTLAVCPSRAKTRNNMTSRATCNFLAMRGGWTREELVFFYDFIDQHSHVVRRTQLKEK